jgi:flagellar protein FliS
MLYDGTIAAMQRAVTAIESHDIAKKCTHLNRALAIISQLEGTLNFEKGGEVAQTLKSLYLYARTQVMKGNIENSPQILRSLMEKFTTVREAWHEAEHQARPSPEASAGEESLSAPLPAPSSPPPPSPARPARRASPYGASIPPEPGSLRFSA